MLYQYASGTPLDRIAVADQAEVGVRRAARWLARLHTSDVSLPRVFSLHQEDNYPVKEPGDRDIGLISFDPARSGSPWVEDTPYLEVLEAAMPEVLDEARPDLVLYQAGADPYRHDQQGGIRLTLKGLERRDEMVFAACRRQGIPVATTFGGGYAVDVEDTIAIHLATVRAAGRVLGEAA